MFDITNDSGPKPRCYFTQANLPTFVNHEQPSTKKPPFSIALKQQFSHTLDIVLPSDAAKRLQQSMTNGNGTLRYSRVHMKLGEIIEGDFFNQYIKTGHILMLSQGRPSIDHVFSLSDGVLRLEVDRPTYERLGLEGKAVPSLGRKHVKARFAIELNLRLPSMVHGKKGFERIVWAFKNVLNHTVTWLFYDLRPATDGQSPLDAFQPKNYAVEPEVTHLDGILVPTFPTSIEEEDHEDATELLEWLTLVIATSSRVQHEDNIDPYLCRYTVPDFSKPSASPAPPRQQDLTRLRYHGFIPSPFAHKLLLATLKASAEDWFSLSATSFGGETYTILKSGDRTLSWEYAD